MGILLLAIGLALIGFVLGRLFLGAARDLPDDPSTHPSAEGVGARSDEALPAVEATSDSADSTRRTVFSAKPGDVHEPTLEDELARMRSSVAQWPPRSGTADFDDVDLSWLRRAVQSRGSTAADLVSLLERSAGDPVTQSMCIAAFAYVDPLPPGCRELILEHMRGAYPAESSVDGVLVGVDHVGKCYAGLFALQMKGAAQQLDGAIQDVLDLQAVSPPENHLLASLTAFAMSGMVEDPSPPVREHLERIAARPPQAVLTSAVFRALCQTSTPSCIERIAHQAQGGHGFAREGLERVRHPGSLGALEQLASGSSSKGMSVAYAKYLTASAARGLLSIEDPAAGSAFERLALSENPASWGAAWRALELDPPANAAGTILLLSTRARSAPGGHPILGAAESALASIGARLGRATVADADRAACTAGLLAVLPSLTGDRLAARTALEILTQTGKRADKPGIDRYSRAAGLSAEDHRSLQASWDQAHPSPDD